MLADLKNKDFFHPFAIWLIILIWCLFFGDKVFPTFRAKLDNFITSQSFWFFYQPPNEANEITIVAIDHASRHQLGLKWPWKRDITAELIRNIASYSPKVIGLDIIFSGSSNEAEDNQLIAGLKSHPRIVLGYILNKNFQEKPNQKFVDVAYATGFVDRPSQEGIVNKIKPFNIDIDTKLNLSIDVAILLAYFGLNKEDLRTGEKGIFLKDKLFIPSLQGLTPLNYLVFHSNFKIISASSVLDKTANPLDFRDKIILVGSTDPLIHDEYLTPMGVFPGVTIIANSLVMLLSKRFLFDLPVCSYLLAFILGLIIIFVNKESDFLSPSIFSLFLIIVILFMFIYLRSKDLKFNYVIIICSVISAYILCNFYKYLYLIYISNHIKNQAIFDPITGSYFPRYFLLQLDEKMKSNQNMAFIGIRVRDYKRLIKDLSFEQLKLLFNHSSNFLISELSKSFKRFSFSFLSFDTLGILLEREKKDRIATFVDNIFEKLKNVDWELGDKKIGNFLQPCIIYKSKKIVCNRSDVMIQMENLFKKKNDNEILTENIKEIAAVEDGRENSYKGSLDFIVYDWEEKNKDLEKNLKEILEINRRLDRLNLGTLTTLARTIDAKSPWTAGHSERVTDLALKIGRVLGLSDRELTILNRAGLLHDIGKIGTPLDILDKPGKLTDKEYRIICEHPEKGGNILQPIDEYTEVIPAVVQHHEWFNGKGYPNCLSGESISLGGRILAVADVFDALISLRPYRNGMPLERAFAIIKEGSGTQFDPMIVEAFLKLVQEGSYEKFASPVF